MQSKALFLEIQLCYIYAYFTFELRVRHNSLTRKGVFKLKDEKRKNPLEIKGVEYQHEKVISSGRIRIST